MIRQAGQALGAFFSRPGVRNYLTNAGIEAGAQVAAEQLLPRALGQTPQSSLAESIIRQGTSAAVGYPIQKGLGNIGLPGPISYIGAQLIGQPAGQFAAQSLLPGNQSYPIGMDPEPTQAGHAGYGQLMAQQQIDAMAERERYNNMINLALARNYNPPSFIRHSSSGSTPVDAVNEMVKLSRQSYF